MSRVTEPAGDPWTGVEDRAIALLASTPVREGAEEAAERMIRRLANRHGCTRAGCPDPDAHRRDVTGMTLALQAVGLGGMPVCAGSRAGAGNAPGGGE